MHLRVGLVARCLNTQHVRGMGRYVYEVLQQSKHEADLEWCLFANNPEKPMVYPPDIPAQADVFEFKGDRFRFWEQLGVPIRCIKRNVDLLHCTESTLPLWQPKPTVVTVHDTLMWDGPFENKTDRFYFNQVLPAAMKKAAAVITISESSKNDILGKWPWLESKLTVIPHGISQAYFVAEYPDLPSRLKIKLGDTPYIVYLGGPMERKRFSWALEVFARVHKTPIKMVVCGFGQEARDKAVDTLPLELKDKVVFADFLSDDELLSVYKNSRAVLYPTLYEGFGFPAIESQAAGAPVLFSALGSLKELIGPLAIVLPPDDIDAWVTALEEAVTMGEQKTLKAKSAQEWAKNFSWAESAKRHFAVYREAVKFT